ncbi:Protein phosphatase 1 regulatory subunit 21 [Nymphon striatum]|nr:Protein phosphatase 1 regulatory subunit 21 [Nymphon striatum]
MDTNPVDLQVKYQKLASEYAKMRAQVSVLKKAVLDEQSKLYDSQNLMKEKEQSNRKYEQEMESLTFRNQQLSKRILILQDEFEEVERNSKKGKHKSNANTNAFSNSGFGDGSNVISEELQHKIEENAELHKKLHSLEYDYQNHIVELNSKLDKFERDASHHQEALSGCEERNQVTIDKLTKVKARLELKLQSEEKILKETSMKAEMCQENLDMLQGDLGTKLSATTKTLQDKLLFNDTSVRELNSLNIPTVDCKQQKAVRQLVSNMATSFTDFVNALSNFHTYNEQRITIFYEGQQISPVNLKLVEHLHSNASKLRPLSEAFTEFCNGLSENFIISLVNEIMINFIYNSYDLQKSSSHSQVCPKYSKNLFTSKLNERDIHSYMLLGEDLAREECSLSACSPSLESKNMDLHCSVLKLSRVLNKVLTYIEFISFQSHSNKMCKYPESSQVHVLHLLSSSLISLHSAFKDVWKQFNNKLTLEHQLPTMSEELKRTNECVLSSLISLVNCVGKISSLLSGNIAVVGSGITYKCRGSNLNFSKSNSGMSRTSPSVFDFQKRATNYLSMLDEDEPECVPYEEALKHQEILNSSSESREGLAKQLQTMQDKVHKLEQAKEHWMLEFQLLEIKHERDLKLGEVEKMVRNASDADSREDEIKKYFTAKINDLVTQMQLADSRGVTFQTECSSLQKKYFIAEKKNLSLQEEASKANDSIVQLKEELQLTKKTYESQLNTMSEHLANLNETLTSQKDEIDELKYALKHKGQKKGKSK